MSLADFCAAYKTHLAHAVALDLSFPVCSFHIDLHDHNSTRCGPVTGKEETQRRRHTVRSKGENEGWLSLSSWVLSCRVRKSCCSLATLGPAWEGNEGGWKERRKRRRPHTALLLLCGTRFCPFLRACRLGEGNEKSVGQDRRLLAFAVSTLF